MYVDPWWVGFIVGAVTGILALFTIALLLKGKAK